VRVNEHEAGIVPGEDEGEHRRREKAVAHDPSNAFASACRRMVPSLEALFRDPASIGMVDDRRMHAGDAAPAGVRCAPAQRWSVQRSLSAGPECR
jgi:hypothetical protein